MRELLLIGIALFAGIGAFVLILKKYGSECVP
jgi:hypothetical protein